MQNFQEYLASTAEGIQGQIKKSLDRLVSHASGVHKDLVPLVQLYADRNFGGKSLRGCLVRLGYELSGSRFSREIFRPAAAIELFQTAILTHDDVIDLSPIRRGKPTVYRALGGDHYGVSQAICLGDIGFFLAVRLILESRFDPTLKAEATLAFSQMVINTGLGEILDVALPKITKNRTEKAVLTIHKLKTSYYTIIYPLTIGALLGGAKGQVLDNIQVFGENLGIAFQIQDDILGVFGDEKQLGKSVTSDIEEGKNTLLYTEAIKRATPPQRAALDRYYGRGSVSAKGFESVRKVFIETGSTEYSREQAGKYIERGKAVIPRMTSNPRLQRLLAELADFLVTREK